MVTKLTLRKSWPMSERAMESQAFFNIAPKDSSFPVMTAGLESDDYRRTTLLDGYGSAPPQKRGVISGYGKLGGKGKSGTNSTDYNIVLEKRQQGKGIDPVVSALLNAIDSDVREICIIFHLPEKFKDGDENEEQRAFDVGSWVVSRFFKAWKVFNKIIRIYSSRADTQNEFFKSIELYVLGFNSGANFPVTEVWQKGGYEVFQQRNTDELFEMPEPLGEKIYKGNLTVRVPPEVHRKLAIKSAEEGVSINQYILSKIAK